MKTFLRVLILLGFLIGSSHVRAAIIADHNVVAEFESIPDYWIEKVKQEQVLIQCVGQSHSYQYENGLLLLEQSDPRCAVQIAENLSDLNTENRLHILRSQYSTAYRQWGRGADDNDYWSTEEGRVLPLDSARQAIVEGHPIAASIWCWCWDICCFC